MSEMRVCFDDGGPAFEIETLAEPLVRFSSVATARADAPHDAAVNDCTSGFSLRRSEHIEANANAV